MLKRRKVFLFLADLDVAEPKRMQDLRLCLPHTGFLFRRCMVVPQKMQHAVHYKQLHFRLKRVTGGIGLGLGREGSR